MFEFVGRVDHQVKIRGFRVELGEVESRLNALHEVRNSAVVLRTDAAGNPMLIAFWLGADEKADAITSDRLRARLAEVLPDYMIPARIERLARFPLTSNLKVNRQYLTITELADILAQHGFGGTDHSPLPSANSSRVNSQRALVIQLLRIAGGVLNVAADRLDLNRALGELGFDSIRFTKLAVELNRSFDMDIDATLFFQHKTLQSLAEFLLRNHADRVGGARSAERPVPGPEPIAIIGVDARLPQAVDVDQFWKNLIEGRDCVTGFPAERLDRSANESSPLGAYIEDVDKFDAPFFGISPREAATLDPRQRLFLETTWRAIENAGRRPSELAGTRTGVFVGVVGAAEYSGETEDPSVDSTAQLLLGSALSFIPSRVSHHLDLAGPSAAIDTACSSSLVALHRAVTALQSGQCDLAIAGGVNLILDPQTTRAAAKTGMISPSGRCRTFDVEADGYVRGEGVAAVLLKPLAKAKQDGDPIHAVILGSAENHGGRAAALTAPNPVAQSRLIEEAIRRAGVDPSSVTYIETHGTGTQLGDPIEINGLKEAFAAFRAGESKGSAWCGLGSVKTNIGHLEAAAGIAGVVKVLLAMRHGEIPGNLHFNNRNPKIQLERSPFFIVDENIPWNRIRDGGGAQVPRRAGVSSFGFSGANAHVVLEEYQDRSDTPAMEAEPSLILLSARNRGQLLTVARNLSTWIEELTPAQRERISLRDVADTLRFGRPALAERLALVAGDFAEARRILGNFVERRKQVPDLFLGTAGDDSLADEAIEAIVKRGDLRESAKLWTDGVDLGSSGVLPTRSGRRISLPSYPFERRRYWLRQPAGSTTGESPRFEKAFKAGDWLLAQHVVGGRPILPAVAYLRLVQEAAGPLAQAGRLDFDSVTWLRPFSNGGLQVRWKLENGGAEFFVECSAAREARVHARGRVKFAGAASQGETLELPSIEDRCPRLLEANHIYQRFGEAGVDYGECYRSVEQVRMGDGEALGKIVLPSACGDRLEDFALHPSLLDGALQVAAVLSLANSSEPRLPFSVDSVELLAPIANRMWVHASGSSGSAAEIVVADDGGRVCLRLSGFATRPLKQPALAPQVGEIADAVEQLPKESLGLDPAKVASDSRGFEIIEEIGRLIALKMLQGLDFFREPGRLVRITDLRSGLEAPPKYHRLCDLVISFLRQGGIVEEREDGAVATEFAALPQTARELEELDVAKERFYQEYPDLAPHGLFVWRCVEALPEVISQRLPATEVMFPQGSVESIARIYQGTVLMDYFNRLTAAAVREGVSRLVRDRPESELPVRILEVGAGSGATTLRVSEAVAEFGDRVEYVFSDISAAFRRHGKSRLGEQFPRMKFQLLDIEKDISAQGFGRHSVDIVIGANVLHTTRSLQRSLQTIKSILKPGGMLALVEAIEARVFNGLTYGLLDGWWRIEDGHRRLPNTPHLSAEQWETALREEGFRDLRVLGRSSEIERQMFQAVIIGESDGSAHQNFADKSVDRASEKAPRRSTMALSSRPSDASASSRRPISQPRSAGIDDLEQRIVSAVRQTLQSEEEFSFNVSFDSLGVDSILAVEIAEKLNETLPVQVRSTDLFNFATVRVLTQHLQELMNEKGVSLPDPAPVIEAPVVETPVVEVPVVEAPRVADSAAPPATTPVAIIGLSCQFPEAANAAEFWSNLRAGRDCVREVPPSRWPLEGFFSEDRKAPARSYGKWGGFLPDAAGFDPLFFNFSPRDAEFMDPQQRMFLMESWRALEDAGYSDTALDGCKCGVFVGCATGDYEFKLRESDDWGEAQAFTGNAGAILAARISYHLNLKGPCLTIDTACSASLVAVHTACESVRAGDSELALAGGVAVFCTPRFHVWASKAGMLSADGRCKTFAADADGIVPSEGAGVVVLKLLDDAIRDGDHIYGVIRGSGVNQDGKTNGITAPSAPSQTALEVEVYEKAGVNPETIDYIECHGTGTRLGDPIEVQALTDAFRRFTNKREYCGLGSVKSNIGHALSAAGVAGLIKMALALKHGEIPPSIHCSEVNEKLELRGSPFYLSRESRLWNPRPDQSRRAAISAFGFSGTNAHVLIEEAPELPAAKGRDKSAYLVAVSARTEGALSRRLEDLDRWLLSSEGSAASLQQVSRTLNVGRSHFHKRSAFVAASMDELRESVGRVVGGENPGNFIAGNKEKLSVEEKRSGSRTLGELINRLSQGDPGDYRLDLFELGRSYTRGFDPDWSAVHQGESIRRCLLPSYPFDLRPYWYGVGDGSASLALDPAPVADGRSEFSRQFGDDEPVLTHHVVQGRAILPGVAYLELVLQAARSRMPHSRVELRLVTWLRPFVGGGELRVVSDPAEARFRFVVESAAKANNEHVRGEWRVAQGEAGTEQFDLNSVRSRVAESVDVSAFYDWFTRAGVDYGAYFRCLAQLWVGTGEALARVELPVVCAAELTDSILQSSLLDGALQAAAGLAWEGGGDIAKPRLPFSVDRVEVIAPLKPEMWVYVSGDLGQGAEITLMDSSGSVCVRLTGYTTREPGDAPTDSYLAPVWVAKPLPDSRPATPSGVVWLICDQHTLFEEQLSAYLGDVDESGDVRELRLAKETGRLSERVWSVDTRDPTAMGATVPDLPRPSGIYYSLHLETTDQTGDLAPIMEAKERGILSLFRLIKALQRLGWWEDGLRLTVITRNVWNAIGAGRGDPAFAAVAGLLGSVRNEYPGIETICVDIEDDLAETVASSISAVLAEPVQRNSVKVAWRNGRRYEQVFRSIEVGPADRSGFRERGVYVIVGGVGGIGLALGRHLAGRYRARVALLGRRPLDAEIEQKLKAISALGGEAVYRQADVACETDIDSAFGSVRERWGTIDGVVHSAIVLRDRGLARMREEDFVAALDPKVEGIVTLAHAAREAKADWLLGFSSISSFLTVAGQSNYAAGSLFLDTYAGWAEQGLGLPVRIINWGYWGEIGVVANERYRAAMAEFGMGSIREAEGMEVVERVLAHGISQTAYVKGTDRLMREQLGVERRLSAGTQAANAAFGFERLTRKVADAEFAELNPSEDSIRRDFAAVERLDRLGEHMLAGKLRSLGVLGDGDNEPDWDRLKQRLGVIPRHERLFKTLQGVMMRAQTGGEHRDYPELQRGFLEDYPEFAGHSTLLRACVEALPEVLSGKRPATDVMFPDGSLRLVETIYTGTLQTDYLNRLMAVAVACAVQMRLAGLPQGETVRIVEIGAGTGSTTAFVAKALQKYQTRVDYVYSDVSWGFKKQFQNRFSVDCPFMRFEVIDLDRGLAEQGLAVGEADIILAANALHVCASLDRSLQLLRGLLKPDGCLALNEVRKVTVFNSLTYGLLDGWWRFEDAHRRLPDAPVLSRSQWKTALIEEGFPKVAFGEQLRNDPDDLVATLILAQSGGSVSSASLAAAPKGGPEQALERAERPAVQPGDRKSIAGQVEQRVAAVFHKVIRVAATDMTPDASFDQMGVDSIVAVELVDALNQELGIELRSVDLFNYTTLPTLVDRIIEVDGDRLRGGSSPGVSAGMPAAASAVPKSNDIAVIGYSIRAPGADSPAEFWANLSSGEDSVSEVPSARWQLEDFYTVGEETPGRSYCRHGGFLSDIDQFDPLFFNISPHEAELMDPQQRVFLMESWRALEDAGYAGRDLDGVRCGVFAGCSVSDYDAVLRNAARDGEAYSFMGLSPAILPSRISYWLNLKGPSIAVDTACSSSAVAIHLACESLLQGTSDVALTGGVSIFCTPRLHVLASQTGMLSRTGACRTFGAGADGFVPGEACAVLFLKRLDDAVRDGDHIHGVIRGSAINQDGKSTGITAPNGPSQTALELSVYEKFGIDPTTIGYVECHGTGTKLGDPIEIGALGDAFRRFTDRTEFCAVGSVKSNIGHTLMAAAAAGVIKVLLSLKHEQLPPTLHCEETNPDIDFETSPFFPNHRLRQWKRESGQTRRAAVSSFGFSGTNVHLVIEDPPPVTPAAPSTGDWLFTLSANNEVALRSRVEDLVTWLDDGQAASLEEISHGLNVGRSHLNNRIAIVAGTRVELRQSLKLWLEGAMAENALSGTTRRSIAAEAEQPVVSEPKTRRQLLKLGGLYVDGRDLEWAALYPGSVRRIPLPVYPFTMERFWADPPADSNHSAARSPKAEPDGTPRFEEMLFVPTWREEQLPAGQPSQLSGPVLLVDKGTTLARALQERQPGLTLIPVEPGGAADCAKIIENESPRTIIVRAHDEEIGIEDVYRLTRTLVSSSLAEQIRFIFVHPLEASPSIAAVAAFLETVAEEQPRIRVMSLAVDDEKAALEEFFADDSAREVRRCHGGREVKTLAERPVGREGCWLRDEGVCLISGGAGGLGWIFSKHLIEKHRARLVWIGRSEPDAALRAKIDKLAALGGQVLYAKGDVSRKEDVQVAVRLAKERYGAIHGVIHAAGVLRNNFLLNKEIGELRRVLAPKLLGAVNLDEALTDEPLDGFLLFSSVAALLPEVGQSDYAYANRFLDEFAAWRERLRARNLRSGRSLSINWQMWRDGGMATGAELAEHTEFLSGLPALQTPRGIRLLDRAVRSELTSGLFCYGKREPVTRRISQVNSNPAQVGAGAGDSNLETDFQERTDEFVKQRVADLFKVPVEQFEMDKPFAEYGLDSIIVTRFNSRIAEEIPDVSRTLLFEFPHALALSAQLASTHRSELKKLLSPSPMPPAAAGRPAAESVSMKSEQSAETPEIAIIGLAGRYPEAPDLAAFWDNLSKGRDCIREVPAERWDAERFYDADRFRASEGKIYCKWGGFLAGVDQFDAGFFSIAPVEAETLDPQARIFLETAWHALEDAGYARSRLAAWRQRQEQANVGVFAGVTQNSYQLLGVIRNTERPTHVDHSGEWSLANHVSYFFNFIGPSLPVDTACSASLTAIHLACESLRQGECEMALAGGVNLHLHPVKYSNACALGMLSPSGKCHSFGEESDGYVPGEGSGVVILKPLDQARIDGDHIYGVIKASAVNHGGRTNGFSVPSPAAQAAVVSQAMRKAALDPRTISYVEAHGTGTKLGDPVEVEGLTRAFVDGPGPSTTAWCALGSVKSNIGHLEAAAGVAGLTKILLQMRHRQLVPTLNSERPNPDIDFSRTPFALQREREDWNPETSQPRRAGISSFGAGGSNAHLIVEEYATAAHEAGVVSQSAEPQSLLVLSARGETELKQSAANLLRYLRSPDSGDLRDVVYTLQVARAELPERVAFVVHDRTELEQRLEGFVDSLDGGQIRGRAGKDAAGIDTSEGLEAVASAWVNGADVDWRGLYPDGQPRRAPLLPGYPFRKDRYWYGSFAKDTAPLPEPTLPATAVVDASNWRESAGHFEARPEVTMERIEKGIVVVRMEDRRHRNMFTEALLRGLMHCFDEIERDPGVKAVVVTGCDNVFSMGGTREELLNLSDQVRTFADMEFIFKGFLQCRVPVISAIQGHASGGGLVFGLYADIVVMAEEGFYSAVFTRYGFTPGLGATFILADKLGGALAAEMMMTAATYRGTDFMKRGANVLFHPQARVFDEAVALARSLVQIPDYTLKTLKESLSRRKLAQLPAVISEELRMHGETFGNPEVKERISKFIRDENAEPLQDNAPPPPDPAAPVPAGLSQPTPAPVPEAAFDELKQEMARSLGDKLHLEPEALDGQASFRDLGLDSITGVEFVHAVNRDFGLNLDASIVYDFSNFDALSEHVAGLVARHPRRSGPTAPGAAQQPAPVKIQLRSPLESNPGAEPNVDVREPICLDPVVACVETPPDRSNEMAIIGMSCRLPGAPDLETFWRNLANGVDSIVAVPEDRWDVERDFDPDPDAIGKTYCKWGGFVDEVDCFDPLFFNLSHAEAEVMDPQQRLFLEEAWKAFEHAGYSSKSLNNSKCGLFVGAAMGEYGAVLRRENPALSRSAFSGTGLTPSIMVARVSYLLNLKGPSVALDTACSSSLVALHQACRSIETGDCDMALAGGINLILEPDQMVTTSKLRMLSPSGRCRPFDCSADGIALSEGVAIVVIKRLDEAVNDRDRIYGVIKASGINQDGKTNGITSPSAVSQAELQREVLERAGVNPEEMGMMEAHGTGTLLGDPVEVRGLTEAFRPFTQKRVFCALGSVKSNIGHTSFAAGLAGVIKVLLSFEHSKIPPSLHFERPNEEIHFGESPFFVNTELREWVRVPGKPRLAAVSSFGYSGTNAYVVLTEPGDPARVESDGGREVIVLSAKTEPALKETVERLLGHLDPATGPDLRLADLAFTLQTGRDAMEFRLAWIVGDLSELRHKLDAARHGDLADAYHGSPTRGAGRMVDPEQLEHVAQAWVEGAEVDWTLLHQADSARPTALPTYPFARERCWVQPAGEDNVMTALSADDPRLKNHRVDQCTTVSGSLMVELAVAAIAEVKGVSADSIELESVVWLRPMIVETNCELRVRLRSEDGGSISFEILNASGKVVHAEGRARIVSARSPEHIDLDSLSSPGANTMSGEELYQLFAQSGLDYGAGFRVIEDLRYGDNEAIGRLRLPAGSESKNALNNFVLDGALQTAAVLASGSGGATPVPFSIGKMRFTRLSSPAVAHVRRSSRRGDVEKFHVRILDANGTVVLDAEDFTIRATVPAPTYLRPRWERRELPARSNGDGGDGKLLLFGSANGFDGELRAAWPGLEVLRVGEGEGVSVAAESATIRSSEEASFEQLLDKTAPDYIIYCVPRMAEDPTGAFEALFPLSKALVRKGLTKKVTILCIGPDAADPAFMALGAFGRTVTQEQPLLRFKTLATGSVDASCLLEMLG